MREEEVRRYVRIVEQEKENIRWEESISRKSTQQRMLEDINGTAVFIGILGGIYLCLSLELGSFNPAKWKENYETRNLINYYIRKTSN